jgi:hypothetical protein
MRAATLEMPPADLLAPRPATSEEDHAARAARAALVTGDGKTLHQETLDSAQAAGIAILGAAAMLLALLTGIVMLLLG